MNYAFVELLQYVPNYMELVQGNRIEIVYQLLGHGLVSSDKFMSDDFMSPMALACQKGHLKMAKLLWRNGASIEAEIKTHIPPLHAAIRGGQVEVVRWLLEQGADVTCRYGGYYWRRRRMDEVDAVMLASYLDNNFMNRLLCMLKIEGADR